MNKMLAALAALRYGSSLTDPAVWKNRQLLLNALMGLLGAVAYFVPVEMSHDDQKAVAGGLAVAVGLLNAYLTAATSAKVGLPARDSSAVRPDDYDSGQDHAA
ncbi:hypothetical protein U5817_10090 [Aromatoleum evansii]|uniref:Holin n=1 Tax=Aromatoleum evansii TaxID=59406 RepID=A0ABZ1AV14_AROEV|nr:hypothetical protein U5817_09740 [Aromatoleum evansii]WRL48377.1 hypothetical protein U5817_10090 [Aromatoleum evansii]